MTGPNSTAVRVALWRALHGIKDSPPKIIDDDLGLKLIDPPSDWMLRPDMDLHGTRGYRASIVGRTRLIEDLVIDSYGKGVYQYVILGAGLDSFAQRWGSRLPNLKIFEVDAADTLTWKQKRLQALGLNTSQNLNFVEMDFARGDSWLDRLNKYGFSASQKAMVASAGVSMYLDKAANLATLAKVAQLSPGSHFIMSFILPLHIIGAEERAQHEFVYERARLAGTPFLSFYSPDELIAAAQSVGCTNCHHISRQTIIDKYFLGRSDGLVPSTGEELLLIEVGPR